MSTVQQFDFSVNALKALLWQHDNAARLKTLIELKQDWYTSAHTDFWTNWIRDVFDVRTANEFGLAVWSRILDIPLGVDVDASLSKPAFGFGTNHKNFENGNFARAAAGQISLTLEQKRLVIQLRYFQLTTRATVPEVNEFLAALFSTLGQVFVVDSLDMSFVTYFFRFTPDSDLTLILEKYDLFPRPAGVGVRYQVQVRPAFGFGVAHLNFENGNFGE